jgi:hypothetical protein
LNAPTKFELYTMAVLELIRIYVLSLFFVLCLCSGSIEQQLEEVVRKSISLDFSIFGRNESYFINIINQNGYRICSGTVDRNAMKQVDCKYNTEHLNYGDNTFYITIYSKKTNAIVFETTSGFHYGKPRAMRWVEKVQEMARDLAESVAHATTNGESAKATTRKVAPAVLAVTGAGAGYVLSKQENRQKLTNFVRRKWGSEPLPRDDSEDCVVAVIDDTHESGPPPPPSLPLLPGPPAPRAPLWGSLRSTVQKTVGSRSTRVAGLMLGAALLGRGTVLPALQRVHTSRALPKPLLDLADKLRQSIGGLKREKPATLPDGAVVPALLRPPLPLKSPP